MLRQTVLILLGSLPVFPALADPPACIDAVVRAKILAYHPQPLGPLADDEIVMSWTWDVDIEVLDVYLGDIKPGKLTIGATLHTEFDHRLHQPVFFLSRRFGRWDLSYIEFAARAAGGGYVIPVFDAPGKEEISPSGWLPSDYARWLHPVSYRNSDVESFSEPYLNEKRGAPWVMTDGGRVIARRGYAITDVPAMLAERRSLDCVRDEEP